MDTGSLAYTAGGEDAVHPVDTCSPSVPTRGGPPARDVLQTYTGKVLQPLSPQPGDFCIEDIAWSLAHQCRYNGHTRMFYSVATHCLLVAHFLPSHLKLEGLLHDASEAYLTDLPSPLKQAMPEYRAYEAKLEHAISLQYGLTHPSPEVKAADDRVFQLECALVMGGEIERKFSVEHFDRLFVETEILRAAGRQPAIEAERFLVAYRMMLRFRGRELQELG